MTATSFAGSSIAVRADLVEAHERAWDAVATPVQFYRVKHDAQSI